MTNRNWIALSPSYTGIFFVQHNWATQNNWLSNTKTCLSKHISWSLGSDSFCPVNFFVFKGDWTITDWLSGGGGNAWENFTTWTSLFKCNTIAHYFFRDVVSGLYCLLYCSTNKLLHANWILLISMIIDHTFYLATVLLKLCCTKKLPVYERLYRWQ